MFGFRNKKEVSIKDVRKTSKKVAQASYVVSIETDRLIANTNRMIQLSIKK